MSDSRTVTDLETTALEALHTTHYRALVAGESDPAIDAVRELARRAEQASDLEAYVMRLIVEKDEIRADRDTLQRAYDGANHNLIQAEADRDRLQAEMENAQRNYLRLADEHKTEHERGDRYREALEQVKLLAPGTHAEAIARAALATPDTPPAEVYREDDLRDRECAR